MSAKHNFRDVSKYSTKLLSNSLHRHMCVKSVQIIKSYTEGCKDVVLLE